jgi:hypothetical protein
MDNPKTRFIHKFCHNTLDRSHNFHFLKHFFCFIKNSYKLNINFHHFHKYFPLKHIRSVEANSCLSYFLFQFFILSIHAEFLFLLFNDKILNAIEYYMRTAFHVKILSIPTFTSWKIFKTLESGTLVHNLHGYWRDLHEFKHEENKKH